MSLVWEWVSCIGHSSYFWWALWSSVFCGGDNFWPSEQNYIQCHWVHAGSHLHGAKGKQRVNENVVVINVVGQQPLKCPVLFIPVPSFFFLVLWWPKVFIGTACSIYVQNSWKQTLREYQHSNVCMFVFTICGVCIYTDTRVKLECVMTCGMTHEKLNIKERKSAVHLTSMVLTHGHPSKHTNITLLINHIGALSNLHHSSHPQDSVRPWHCE